MKITTTTLLCLGTLALALPASAQVYQWKDASGRTVVSDTPPPGNVKPAQSSARPPATTTAQTPPAKEAPTTATPASAAERDLEFKKRQKENQEKADKAAKEQAASAERQENCKRARQSLSALESGQRIATTNEKGEREFMEDNQRQAEIARARKIVDDSCK